MARRGVVFVGPSLRCGRPSAASLDVRPPARRGDVLAAAVDGAPVIGLIDGLFGQDLAVTPAEVRAAAQHGARLIGGASMGALRAVDCPGAMTGVGEIYAAFARGELTDDDEVALTFTPDTFEPVAYPLVQVRAAVALVVLAEPALREDGATLVGAVRTLPFVDRVPSEIRSAALEINPDGRLAERVLAALVSEASDVKRRDAEAVVAAVEAALATSRAS